MKLLAVVISVSDRLNHSRPLRPQKSQVSSCRMLSGSSPDQIAMSRIMANIFLRCSAEMLRPSPSLISTTEGRFCARYRLMSLSGSTTSFLPSPWRIFAVIIM